MRLMGLGFFLAMVAGIAWRTARRGGEPLPFALILAMTGTNLVLTDVNVPLAGRWGYCFAVAAVVGVGLIAWQAGARPPKDAP